MFKTARFRLVARNLGVFFLILASLGVAVFWFFSRSIYQNVDQDLNGQKRIVQVQLDKYAAVDSYSPSLLLDADPTLILQPYRVLATDSYGTVAVSTECYTRPLTGSGVLETQPICPADTTSATSAAGIAAAMTAANATAPPYTPGDPAGPAYPSDMRTVTFRGQPWRVLTFAVVYRNTIAGVVQIAKEVSGEENALHELTLLLVVGILAGLVLAGLGSVFLASRALVPINAAFNRQRQFTADASHELRTPLALIRANAEMLYRHNATLPAGDTELIGEIIQETDHLNRLVGDLLTLARADADSLKLASRPVDLRGLVSDVLEDLSRIAESHGIQTSVMLNGPVTVQGDEGRLRQLLLILVDNSLKYTDPGGKVEVSVGREDKAARLVVSDTGIGIPPKDLTHVFDRFYRVDRAREHESGGTGLGLSIAQWIVQAHHGQIKAESELGKGTRFQVDLPAIQQAAPAIESSEE